MILHEVIPAYSFIDQKRAIMKTKLSAFYGIYFGVSPPENVLPPTTNHFQTF
jgi:hypothetical protein